mgnify:CR=1 FL=1
MVDYREILRLSSDSQNSQRSIAARVHSSRDTIREVQKAAQEAGITWPLEEDITNEVLRGILFPRNSPLDLPMRRRAIRTSTKS